MKRGICHLSPLRPLIGAAFLLVQSPLDADEVPALLSPGASEAIFNFETDEIEGTIRLEGPYHGISRLTDKRTGRQVIDSRYSALNLFKLMSVNQVMGQPRRMERDIATGPDWVRVTWPETDSHFGELTAQYTVSSSNSIDVALTLHARGSYRAYELFMSSYFDKTLRPQVYLKPRSGDVPQLVMPTVNDVFRDTVLVFPRDAHSAQHCVDGRWERSERGIPTVQMCPVRHYAYGVAFLTDPDRSLGVVLMSRPDDCYAISTRYHADNDEDRLTTYSAFDLSLFGDDFRPGDERTIRVRLAVTALDEDLSQPLAMYREFLAEPIGDLPTSPPPGDSP